MKKLLILILATLFIFNLQSQENSNYSGSHQLHFGLGYGSYDLSMAGGYKYTFGNLPFSIGGTIGMAGFTTTIPNYIRDLRNVDLNKMEEVQFSTFLVSMDLDLYYEWKDFSFYGSVGYFSESDTVLAKEIKESYTNYYYKKTLSQSGMAFGAGIQYYFKDEVTFGLGFHNKRGLYLQIGYCWY